MSYSQFDPLVNRYLNTRMEAWEAQEALDRKLREIFNVAPMDDLWDDDLEVDTVDWDGVSIELTNCKSFVPTEEQIEQVWALGFTVIRIDFAAPEHQNGSHGITGDWKRCKGYDVGKCLHTELQKP